ncbi:hypothetical protein N9N67_02090 [Bacteriovoracaceae bacterium]|nr:hypothetical protein [Bacteriovoracaceae bacterium]
MKVYLLLVISLQYHILVLAKDGHDKGSGGDVVACFTPASKIYKSRIWYKSLEVELDGIEPVYEKVGNHSLVLNANLKYKNNIMVAPHDGRNNSGINQKFFLVRNGGLTDWGKAFLRSLETFEYFKIKRSRQDSNFHRLLLKNNIEVRYALLKYFKVPGNDNLYNELLKAQDPSTGIGRINVYGSKSDVPLTDIKDNGVARNYHDNCMQLQAVIREGSLLEYDINIWNNLGIHHYNQDGEQNILGKAFHQELLQLHEELYFIGEVHPSLKHKNAMKTIEVIFKMATIENPNDASLSLNDQQKINVLKSTNFWIEN